MSSLPTIPGSLSGHGRSERYSTLEDLSPGQYWRARDDIPDRVVTRETEERSYFDESGSYERDGRRYAKRSWTSRERDGVPAGTILLVTGLRKVEGGLHAVDLAPHPTEPENRTRRFLADEFVSLFEPAEDAEAVRNEEISGVNADIARLQAEMIAGPPGKPALPATVPGDVTSLVALAPRADEISSEMDRRIAIAEERTQFVQERTRQVMERASLLGRYHNERATAALSSQEATIAAAKRIQKGVRSLKLYTGEGIESLRLLEGESAPSSEPLTVYQRRLYLDEEMAVHLLVGGLNAGHLGTLPKLFEEIPGILERLAPSPRSLVLLSLRRTVFVPEGDTSMAQVLDIIARAKADTQSMLLIRDGGNAHLVWSDLIWSYDGKGDDFDSRGLKRLFPSKGDADEPFRGTRGGVLSVEDLEFSEAHERFQDRALAYRRLLLAIFGLHERTGIFGEFYDRNAPAYQSWFSPEFQAERMRFVADDEMALPEAREDLRTYVARNNELIRPGSRVIVDWDAALQPETAPSCFEEYGREGRHFRLFAPTSAWDVAVAKRKEGGTVVSTRVRSSKSEKVVSLDLRRHDGGKVAYLCLDGVLAADIERYVESRRDRKDYLSYLWLFIKARDFLRNEEDAQREAVSELVDAAVAGGVATPEEALAAMREAVRLWRADNKGALLRTATEDRKAHIRILDVAFILLGKDVDFGAQGSAVAEALGRRPARLVVDGSGRIALYASPLPNERLDLFGPHAWAARVPLARKHGKLIRDGEPAFVKLEREVASELVLARYEAEAEWVKAKPFDGLAYRDVRKIVERIDGAGIGFLRKIAEGDGSPEFLKAARDHMQSRTRWNKSGGTTYTTRHPMVEPVGVVETHPGAYCLLTAEMDPMVVHARSGPEGEATARRALSRFQDRIHLQSLERDLAAPRHNLTTTNVRWWLEEGGKPPRGDHGGGWTTRKDQPVVSPWRKTVAAMGRRTWRAGEETPAFEDVVRYLPAAAADALDELDALESARTDASPQISDSNPA